MRERSASAWSARPARSARSRSSCSAERGYATCAPSRPRARPASGCRTATASSRRGGDARGARGGRARPRASSPSGPRRAASSSRMPSAAARSCVDKSAAYRLVDGVPLVVPEVNGARARSSTTASSPTRTAARSRSRCVLKPLHDAAGLARVRVATYQSVSGAGAAADGAAARGAAGRAQPRHGLGVRRRRVRRGVEAPRRDAEDPGAAGAADQRDLRARARARRPLRGGLGRDRASRCRAERRDRAARRRAGRARRRTCRRRATPPAATTCSSAGSAATRRSRTGSRSSSRATTCARARR